MKFPTIPHNIPRKTFREVFNRLLNGYLLENEYASRNLLEWGKKTENEKFKPSTLSNGNTKVELLIRARYILPKSGDKWSESQKKRAKLRFELQPKLKEAYSLVCQLRCIFKNRKLTKTQAKAKLKEWYKAVFSSAIKEIISAKDCIK